MNRLRKRVTFTLSNEAIDLLNKTGSMNKSAYIDALIRKNGVSVHTFPVENKPSVHTNLHIKSETYEHKKPQNNPENEPSLPVEKPLTDDQIKEILQP